MERGQFWFHVFYHDTLMLLKMNLNSYASSSVRLYLRKAVLWAKSLHQNGNMFTTRPPGKSPGFDPLFIVAKLCNHNIMWCTGAQKYFFLKANLVKPLWNYLFYYDKPVCPLTFEKSRTGTQLDNFIPIQVSQELNQKLASFVGRSLQCAGSIGPTLWKIRVMLHPGSHLFFFCFMCSWQKGSDAIPRILLLESCSQHTNILLFSSYSV